MATEALFAILYLTLSISTNLVYIAYPLDEDIKIMKIILDVPLIMLGMFFLLNVIEKRRP